MYGLADGSEREAHNLYHQWFPGHQIQRGTRSAGFICVSRDSGAPALNRTGLGWPWSVSTPDLEEMVLFCFEEEPGTHKRAAAVERISQNAEVWMLHEQLLYPNHHQWVESLSPADCSERAVFSPCLLKKCAINPHFLSDISFTNEA